MRNRWTEEEDAKLKECRKQGVSYKEIAENVLPNRTIDSCKFRGKRFTDGTSDGRFKTKPESVFKEEFENKFPDHMYVSGYTNTDEPFYLKCRKCEIVSERNACCLRKSETITCNQCKEVEKENKKLLKKQERKRISEEKKRIAEEERNRLHEFTCYNCNETFMSRRKKKYCSSRCMNKYNYAAKTLRRRKWAQRNGQVEWDITVDKLIKLYDNTCYLCNCMCDSNDYTYNDGGAFIAGGNYPSIEHVIPLSKGGTHTWDNVRLAHCYCNSVKSDNQLDNEHEQLELPV